MDYHTGRLIDHVHLRVADLERSKAFYRTVFAALGTSAVLGEGPGFFYADELFVSDDGPASSVHLAFQAPTTRRWRASMRRRSPAAVPTTAGPVSAGTAPATTRPTYSTRTATTSRPCTTGR